MTDPHKILTELSDVAQREIIPSVDVRDRVLQTLASTQQVLPPDKAPLAFCGVVGVVAASIVFALFPTWQAMTEPWACYFPQ